MTDAPENRKEFGVWGVFTLVFLPLYGIGSVLAEGWQGDEPIFGLPNKIGWDGFLTFTVLAHLSALFMIKWNLVNVLSLKFRLPKNISMTLVIRIQGIIFFIWSFAVFFISGRGFSSILVALFVAIIIPIPSLAMIMLGWLLWSPQHMQRIAYEKH